ncbi:hypothetical protein P7C70_g9264, partial [Phenoliferia sp. Uapishka_3]
MVLLPARPLYRGSFIHGFAPTGARSSAAAIPDATSRSSILPTTTRVSICSPSARNSLITASTRSTPYPTVFTPGPLPQLTMQPGKPSVELGKQPPDCSIMKRLPPEVMTAILEWGVAGVDHFRREQVVLLNVADGSTAVTEEKYEGQGEAVCPQGIREHACKFECEFLLNTMLLSRTWVDVSQRVLYHRQSIWGFRLRSSSGKWLGSWKKNADRHNVPELRLQCANVLPYTSPHREPPPSFLVKVARVLVESRPVLLEAPFCSVTTRVLSCPAFTGRSRTPHPPPNCDTMN